MGPHRTPSLCIDIAEAGQAIPSDVTRWGEDEIWQSRLFLQDHVNANRRNGELVGAGIGGLWSCSPHVLVVFSPLSAGMNRALAPFRRFG